MKVTEVICVSDAYLEEGIPTEIRLTEAGDGSAILHIAYTYSEQVESELLHLNTATLERLYHVLKKFIEGDL